MYRPGTAFGTRWGRGEEVGQNKSYLRTCRGQEARKKKNKFRFGTCWSRGVKVGQQLTAFP